MSKWRLFFHRAAFGFMCLLFGGMGLLSIRIMPTAPDKPPRILSVLFVVFSAVAITGMLRHLRTIISEFRYDGSKLRFMTVGNREPQTLHLADIVSLREWKGMSMSIQARLSATASHRRTEFDCSSLSSL
jgi:hypothetical protein